ncbi:MAG TPA: 3-dehydroquinate synthase [Pirellulaceae bacterium]|nr:3-dehydroquinate synthase [Pirellulaceae bacterium]
MATTIRVALGERGYDIEIGSGTLAGAGQFVSGRLPGCKQAAIITDENVGPRHAVPIERALAAAGVKCDVVTVPAGEASKSVGQAELLWNELVRRQADRKTAVVAVGGGVVGDLAGLVAATFARGLSLVQIPTSLLAQVDSSVGGKVGINLPAAKNIVGAFWQPAGVLIDLDVLSTLPEREYRSGLAEVVKYGVILDAAFFEYLEKQADKLIARQPEVLEHVIARSCRLKASVVERDEREETGLRAVLNYGHTFCHAIETVTGYRQYLHGEAVSIGMVCAARLAESLGRIDGSLGLRQQALLEKLGLPVAIEGLDRDELLAAMRRDKKAEHGRLRLVLPARLGQVELVSAVDEDLVRRAWSD